MSQFVENTAYSPKLVSVSQMFSTIAGRYDLTNTVLSGGMHHIWKRNLVKMIPKDGSSTILDLCTGTGDLLVPLAKRSGTVCGADFCVPMLEQASPKVDRRTNISIIQADAHKLPFEDGAFDAVTVSFGVRNFKDLEQGLSEIFRILKKNGEIIILEFGQPQNRFFRAFYDFYSAWIMPLIGGILTGNKEAYRYLPSTSKNFPCGQEFCQKLTQIGFKNPKYKLQTFGIAYLYSAEK
ncbi:MAG: bifunctional demethylmenaquinone methyltransferase/2-methoxy-6-polyprenyl-1,4-benzoquinol methylase UbiE [Deltaproteobacteria bacterium]|nr:bifunctional demethylmenaquinone methyltransferase/2-methoxy-6-polyprenyl-1,4-benzoquinol methylase UbiE [Deltaproteobacteria bacterium]